MVKLHILTKNKFKVEENNENQCCTLVLRASKRKLCGIKINLNNYYRCVNKIKISFYFYQDFPHIQNGQVVRGTIIEQTCNVKFIKFIP